MGIKFIQLSFKVGELKSEKTPFEMRNSKLVASHRFYIHTSFKIEIHRRHLVDVGMCDAILRLW